MKNSRRVKNRKSSSSLTFLLVVLLIPAVIFVTTVVLIFTKSAGKQSSPSYSPASAQDASTAQSLYVFANQGLVMTELASCDKRPVVVSSACARTRNDLKYAKKRLGAWMKAAGIPYTKDGHSMPRNLAIPVQQVSELRSATDRQTAALFLSLYSNLKVLTSVQIQDEKLRQIYADLNRSANTAASALLPLVR